MPAALPATASALTASITLEDETDLLYEEDILRNGYSLKYWWRYMEAKKRAPAKQRNMIAERALKYLPGSYKVWHAYLKDRREQALHRRPEDPAIENLNRTYERALVYMHKMPRIWLDYLEFLSAQHRPTATRHAFDRALRALPITQHDRVWELYLKFARACPVKETAVRVYRRYLQFEPDGVEEYVDFLLSIGRFSEAALKLAEMLNRENFVSQNGKSRHKLWMELCDLVCKHPQEVKGLRVEAIIHSGLRTFTDEAGHLWSALADYFIRQAQFEQARDVYEEGISSVMTVRDFSMLFDAYTQFEESMISAKIEAQQAAEAEGGGGAASADEQLDLDMRLARLERLMARRAELLSSVLLRQNPHNVHEWLKRASLFEGQPAKIIHTFATAVKTVDPHRALGKPQSLWLAFALFYEANSDVKNARVILRKATQQPYKTVDDLAAVWMGWAEMELRHKKYDEARKVLADATAIPPAAKRRAEVEEAGPVQGRLYKHTKLWSFYADLQESLGGFDATKRCYEQMIELRIVTPQLVLNFGAFLEEHKHFEESFRCYEKGVALFKYPYVQPIWLTYLTRFVARYGGAKLERARDLFEQALDGCPAEEASKVFLLYAKLEEEHGLARNAMAVYDRATRAVALEQRYELYNMYIAKAAEYFGVTKTRDIYEQAINALPQDKSNEMCVRYANLERKLGEVDRARAIYSHGAQEADPRTHAPFWETWHDFEVAHGNEDTFREMLRVKRSVKAHFSHATVATLPSAGDKRPRDDEAPSGAVDQMAALEERNAPPPPQWTGGGGGGGGGGGDFTPSAAFAGARPGYVFKRGEQGVGYYRDGPAPGAAIADEEIDIDDGDGDDGDGGGGGGGGDGEAQIEQLKVPQAVFGAAGISTGGGGAMDRLRARQG